MTCYKMSCFANSLKFTLLTTTSITSYLLIGELPVNAASFATSEALLKIDDFSILPQNPNADSNRNAIAFTGNETSIADANADGTLSFIIDETNTVLDLAFTSDASGNGSNYFGVGQADSWSIGNFLVDSNETLSFDFTVSLALESVVDLATNASNNTFSGVSFALFDNLNNLFLGEFRAIGNIDTNLANGIDNDTLFASISDSLDYTINSFNRLPLFGGNQESASINVTGSIQQTFTTATEVRLEANTFNISCTQASQTSNPCQKTVPEASNLWGLIFGFLSVCLFYQKRNLKI